MKNLKIYCVTNKKLDFVSKSNYFFGWVGKEPAPKDYLTCNTQDNIFVKEKFYSELTFHYWYWKNQLKNENDTDWIGFCQKRRFWINKNSVNINLNYQNINEHLLNEVDKSWENSNSILCDPINISGAKKIKLIKRGWRNIISNPNLLFGKDRETINVHFDMHHGYGNLNKAISLLDEKDRKEFKKYVNTFNIYHPHIMFIAKPEIIEKWFSTLFPWLERCEEIFGFKNLTGYETKRIYAYLAERYLSFWFKKYSKYLFIPFNLYHTLGSTHFFEFPKPHSGLSLTNIVLNGSIDSTHFGSIMGRTSEYTIQTEEIVNNFRDNMGTEKWVNAFHPMIVNDNLIIIPAKSTMYFKTYFSLPYNKTYVFSTGEEIILDKNKEYTAALYFRATAADILKYLNEGSKKTLEQDNFKLFDGELTSTNQVPLIIKEN